MFEQGLAFVLKQILGEFVEDSSNLQEKLSVGIWSGNIVLENLVLKKEILSVLNLPIALGHGAIGRFELRIPWKKLGVDPVVVVIDGLYILLEPKYEWNPHAKDDREQAVKQAKLAAIELLTSKRLTENPFQGYKDFASKWLMESLVRKLLDNIQVTVTDVHVRYEDQVSCTSNFCLGFSFESLNILSKKQSDNLDEVGRSNDDSKNGNKDENGNETGIKTFQKVLQLNYFSIYWNPITRSGIDICNNSFLGRSSTDIELLMKRTITKRNHQFIDRPNHHHILQPFDFNLIISLDIDADSGDIKVRKNLPLIFFKSNFGLFY